MARRVIGLDVGAYSVKMVRLLTGNQGPRFEITDCAEEILPIDEEDERSLLEKQRDAVLAIYKKALLDGEVFSCGLGANYGQMRNMVVPFTDTCKIEAVLPGLLEAEVPFDVDDMMVSWHRAESAFAETDESVKEDGSPIRVAFGKKESIAKTLQMLQNFSIDPRLMHLSSTGSYELVREIGKEKFFAPADTSSDSTEKRLAAIIDFGHESTSLCVFGENGIVFSKSFLRGGKRLTAQIAAALEIGLQEATSLLHQNASLAEGANDAQSKKLNELVASHFSDLCQELSRAIISAKSSGLGNIKTICPIGGGANTKGILTFLHDQLKEFDVNILSFEDLAPQSAANPSLANALAYSFSCMHIHAKDSRFNFRKDEFAWRGELDFLRAKSVPLILWGLVLICAMTILWSTKSLVLEKENSFTAKKLEAVCSDILEQKNLSARKCLTLIQEQISAGVDLGIPDITASGIYLEASKNIPQDLNVIISELDIQEKRLRISAETDSFEDVDKIVASLTKVPCLTNLEKGRAQQMEKKVKFNLTSDVDCSNNKDAPKVR